MQQVTGTTLCKVKHLQFNAFCIWIPSAKLILMQLSVLDCIPLLFSLLSKGLGAASTQVGHKCGFSL